MKKLRKLLMLLIIITMSTSLMAQMTLKFTTATAGEDITLPLYGAVNVTVDWGDGGSTNAYTTAGDKNHTYTAAGIYTVSITGSLTQYGSGMPYGNADKLTEVTSFGSIGLTSFFGAFYGATNLTVVPASLPSGVTDVRNMFYGASIFNDDISSWDVSNVTNMGAMFYGASIFNQDISGWNVSNVTNMGAMFRLAKAFNQNISTWERTSPSTSSLSNVTNMGGMFQTAIAFNQNIGNWDVSAVSNMAWMFFQALVFNGDIGSWNVSNVTRMDGMLGGAKAFNQPIGNWNISNVTNMTSMFYQAEAFNQDISTWERTGPPVSSLNDVLKMTNMFNGAILFNQDIGNWDVSMVNDMMNMFDGATAFDQDLGDWDVSLVTNMTDMFNGVTLSQTNYDALLIGWKALTSLKDDVIFSAGSSVCTPGAAAEARQYIIDTYGWVFTDGGIDPLTWEGSTDSDWNTAANWDYATLPISTYDVIIANVTNDPIIAVTTSASCNDLTINSGATLTINSTSQLASGSLIVSGTATGNVTYKRWMTAEKWHIVSAPVEGQVISDLFDHPTNSDSIAYKNSVYAVTHYVESINDWGDYYKSDTTGFFTSGKGYLMRRQTDDGTVSFTGTVADADFTVSLDSTDHGWNALGNPFTSALNANDQSNTEANNLITVNINNSAMDDSYAALYIWDEQPNYANLRDDYKVINNAGDIGDSILTQDYIQAGQGFIVKARTNNASFSFTRAMQSHQKDAPFKSAKISDWADINIIVENIKDTISTKTRLKFNNQMTDGLDVGYDAGILKNSSGFNLFTQLAEDNGVEFMLQCLPAQNLETLEIPIGLDATDSGEITFSIEKSNFPESMIPVLNDKLLDVKFAFTSDGDVYNTTINNNTKGFGRFTLTFSSTTDAENIANKKQHFKAWFGNGKINLYGETTGTEIVRVYTISGQEISNTRLENTNLNTIELPIKISGIYLIRIEKPGGIEVLKVPVLFN